MNSVLLRFSAVGWLMLVASCATTGEDRVIHVPVRPVAGIDPDIHDADACTKSGGWWTVVGRDRNEVCVIQAHDSGKACTDDSECEAFCMGPAGTSAGSAIAGTCSSGAIQPCGAMHVRQGRAVLSCVE